MDTTSAAGWRASQVEERATTLDLTGREGLPGDTVATIDPTATSITKYQETTEYGLPRNAATADDDDGYLGATMMWTTRSASSIV